MLDMPTDHINLCELIDWSHPEGNHLVQFWENDEFLAKSVAHFISEGLIVGEGAIVIATKEHLAAFIKSLEVLGIDAE